MSTYKAIAAALLLSLTATASTVSTASAGDPKIKRDAIFVDNFINMNGVIAPNQNASTTTTSTQPTKCKFKKCRDGKGISSLTESADIDKVTANRVLDSLSTVKK